LDCRPIANSSEAIVDNGTGLGLCQREGGEERAAERSDGYEPHISTIDR